jgi:hypothetical protein
MSEQNLSSPVVAWLREQNWDVFQEVGCGGKVADIVVTQGPLLGVVEVKTTLGLSVLEQCYHWRRYANLVWAATPWHKTRNWFAGRVAADYGIGLISVREWTLREERAFSVDENTKPDLRRRVDSRLRDSLRPEHASGDYADAGAIGAAGRYTPFAATCSELRRIVAARPGVMLRDAVAEMRHHYHSAATARSSLAHWIRSGSVKGVELRLENRRLALYPKRDEAQKELAGG